MAQPEKIDPKESAELGLDPGDLISFEFRLSMGEPISDREIKVAVCQHEQKKNRQNRRVKEITPKEHKKIVERREDCVIEKKNGRWGITGMKR